jgi:hypothetical protein
VAVPAPLPDVDLSTVSERVSTRSAEPRFPLGGILGGASVDRAKAIGKSSREILELISEVAVFLNQLFDTLLRQMPVHHDRYYGIRQKGDREKAKAGDEEDTCFGLQHGELILVEKRVTRFGCIL